MCFVSVSVKIVSACKYIFQHTLAYAKLSKCGPWCHLFVAGFGALSYILKTCTGAIYVPSWLPWGLQQMPRAHHACAWCICATCLDLLNTHIIYIYTYIEKYIYIYIQYNIHHACDVVLMAREAALAAVGFMTSRFDLGCSSQSMQNPRVGLLRPNSSLPSTGFSISTSLPMIDRALFSHQIMHLRAC